VNITTRVLTATSCTAALVFVLLAACDVDQATDDTAGPQLLEATLHYDADASPQLAIASLVRRPGTASVAPPVADAGYVAEVLGTRGDVIDSASIELPTFAEDPPPQDGDPSSSGVLQKTVDFAVTLPWSDAATTLRIRDAMAIDLDTRTLAGVPLELERVPATTFRGADPTGPIAVPLLAGPTLDIAFVADGYTAATMQQFRDDTARFSAALLTFEPFHSRASQIVFHAVENTTNLGCAYQGRLILCNTAAATSAVNSSGVSYDKIVVVVNNATYGGSGGAIAMAYNGSLGPSVFVHEFGHSLGGLLDEYVAYSGGSNDGAVHKNCFAGSPPAAAWSGIVATSSYYLECNYPGWYRSTPDSLMRTLSAAYFNTVSRNALVAAINTYAPVTATDTTAPTVSITSPSAGTQVSGTVAVATSASDNTGVAKVELYADNVLVGSDLTSPFSISWATTGTSNGNHVLQARATDLAGNLGASASITVAVNNATSDTTAPTVSITAPATGATVSGLVTVRVAATDNSGTVQRVELYKNGTLFATDTSAPFDLPWASEQGANGTTTLVARAYDPSGNQRDSATTTVTVANLADTTPPTVVIESPSNGAKLTGGWVTISTVASDASGIAKLTISIDTKVVSTCSTTRCSYRVQAKSFSGGTHTITARATDASAAANSAVHTISVTR
jgi:hypothetical protein